MFQCVWSKYEFEEHVYFECHVQKNDVSWDLVSLFSSEWRTCILKAIYSYVLFVYQYIQWVELICQIADRCVEGCRNSDPHLRTHFNFPAIKTMGFIKECLSFYIIGIMRKVNLTHVLSVCRENHFFNEKSWKWCCKEELFRWLFEFDFRQGIFGGTMSNPPTNYQGIHVF